MKAGGGRVGPGLISDGIKFARALSDCPFPLLIRTDEGFTVDMEPELLLIAKARQFLKRIDAPSVHASGTRSDIERPIAEARDPSGPI